MACGCQVCLRETIDRMDAFMRGDFDDKPVDKNHPSKISAMVYHIGMKRELAVWLLVVVIAALIALCALPKQAGASIVIRPQTDSAPIASTTSRLMVGPVMAFPDRNLTQGERYDLSLELQRQIARLSALIARLTR